LPFLDAVVPLGAGVEAFGAGVEEVEALLLLGLKSMAQVLQYHTPWGGPFNGLLLSALSALKHPRHKAVAVPTPVAAIAEE
jgi:hypothetical protein